MNKKALSKSISIALMSVTVLAVTVLGLVGGVTWAGTALADDGGTVPEAPQAFIAGEPTPSPEPGVCGDGLFSDTAPAFVGDPVTRLLEVQAGTAQLGLATGVASVTADTVTPNQLPGSPVGYDLIGCGLRTSGQSTGGGPVIAWRKFGSPRVCFPIDDSHTTFKIAYFDPTPGINRWVFLGTEVDLVDNLACTSPTLRLPSLFALFGLIS